MINQRTIQDRAGQGRAGQGRAKAGQYKTEQDRTRTRQNKNNTEQYTGRGKDKIQCNQNKFLTRQEHSITTA